MDPIQEFDSTWQWVTWAVFFVLFLFYYHYAQELKDHIFPRIVADRGKRQLFDAGALAGGIVIFLMAWGFVLEWIYNG